MQFTGLKDKSGIEDIYESDLVSDEDTGIGEVVWRDAGFKLLFIRLANCTPYCQ